MRIDGAVVWNCTFGDKGIAESGSKEALVAVAGVLKSLPACCGV
jgi:hypothetical protein